MSGQNVSYPFLARYSIKEYPSTAKSNIGGEGEVAPCTKRTILSFEK
jgi:hypothetical protein